MLTKKTWGQDSCIKTDLDSRILTLFSSFLSGFKKGVFLYWAFLPWLEKQRQVQHCLPFSLEEPNFHWGKLAIFPLITSSVILCPIFRIGCLSTPSTEVMCIFMSLNFLPEQTSRFVSLNLITKTTKQIQRTFKSTSNCFLDLTHCYLNCPLFFVVDVLIHASFTLGSLQASQPHTCSCTI